jgi:protein-L-isoaspartate(D-aspartate) O-methyltransferase
VKTLIDHDLLRDNRLKSAFFEVPLERFIPEPYIQDAKIYEDLPNLFYFQNQDNYRTISAPHMITIMLQGLALETDDDLLILGAKSGYIAALAHKLAPKGEIIILEANSEVAKITSENLKNLNLNKNIKVIVKNPLLGMPELSPWQKILVTGSVTQNRIHGLLKQLDPKDGVLYAPIGRSYIQIYTQILRINEDYFGKRQLQVRFTPLMTQVELDELELITDFEQIEIKDDPDKVEETLSKIEEKYSKKIKITYDSKILDDIDLKASVVGVSINVRERDEAVAILEKIRTRLKLLKNEDELEKCFIYTDEIEAFVAKLIKFKRELYISVKKIQNSLNQIRTYNLIRKELSKKSLNESKALKKKIKILNVQIEEINNLENYLLDEIKKLLAL